MAFGSFDSKSPTHTMSEINMVPLIDVMLVLLVIFIITAPLLSHSIQINIPQATAEPVEQEPRVVDLAIDRDGIMYWNDQRMEPEDVAQQMMVEGRMDPQPDVRIRADQDTRYSVLAQVMADARKAGLKRLGFVTRPGQADAPGVPPVPEVAPAQP